MHGFGSCLASACLQKRSSAYKAQCLRGQLPSVGFLIYPYGSGWTALEPEAWSVLKSWIYIVVSFVGGGDLKNHTPNNVAVPAWMCLHWASVNIANVVRGAGVPMPMDKLLSAA